MHIDDAELLAYVDGELSPQRRSAIETAIAASPELAERLASLQASALPYAAAFEAQALPPVPPQLSAHLAALTSHSLRPKPRRNWLPLVGAFAAGALCCTLALKLLSGGGLPMPSVAQVPSWINAVADYQQLYSRATLAHVTEDPRLSDRVISDLRSNDGMTVRVPDLRSAGLTFKRVQRLSFRQRAVVQMVYLPAQGEPVALCVIADIRPDEAPRVQQLGELTGVAWRHNNLGYVLLGKVPAAALLSLGRQLASDQTGSLYGWVVAAHTDAPA
jgi:anti-sigma factor RsiW